MSRTHALEKASVRHRRGNGMMKPYTTYGVGDNGLYDLIDDVAKKLKIDPQKVKDAAKTMGVDTNNPEQMKSLENTLGQAMGLMGKTANIITGSQETTGTTAKPARSKDDVTRNLAVRASVSLVAGAAAGITTGVVTGKPVLGIAAGFGGFVASAVVWQIADPVTSEELDKVFKAEAAKTTTAATTTQEQKKA